jgi:hypothetical protein
VRTTTTTADSILDRTLRGVWPGLPALLIASAALCAAAVVPLLAAPGVNAVSVLLSALTCTPALAALVAVASAPSFDQTATIRSWWAALRTHAGFAVRHGLIAAVPTVLFLAAVQAWSQDGHRWLFLPSVALTGAATILATLGVLAVLTLGVHRPLLRGPALWITALHLVARRPSRFVAAFCLIGLGLWASVSWTASALLLVPAPAAIVVAAAVWTSAAEVVDAQ